MEINDRIIIALDFSSQEEVEGFFSKLDLTQPTSPSFVKVGMELYYAEGPEI